MSILFAFLAKVLAHIAIYNWLKKEYEKKN